VAECEDAVESMAAGDSCRVIQDLSLLLEISRTMESSLELGDIIRPTAAENGQFVRHDSRCHYLGEPP